MRVVRDEPSLLDLQTEVLKNVFFEARGSPRRFLTLLERVSLGGEVVVEEDEKVRSIVDMILSGDIMGVVRNVDKVIKDVGVRKVIPMVVGIVTWRVKHASSLPEVVKLYGVLNAMSLPNGLYAVKEEDKVLYQLLSATFWVRNLKRE
jgi:hypothetical protein